MKIILLKFFVSYIKTATKKADHLFIRRSAFELYSPYFLFPNLIFETIDFSRCPKGQFRQAFLQQ